MNRDSRLVAMANDIAAYFQSWPDHREAVVGMALHLRRFWEPGMRRRIVAHLEAGGTDLLPLAREAIAEVGRHLGEPPTPPCPEGGGDAG